VDDHHRESGAPTYNSTDPLGGRGHRGGRTAGLVLLAAVAVLLWTFLGGPLRWSVAGVTLRCAVGDDFACVVKALHEDSIEERDQDPAPPPGTTPPTTPQGLPGENEPFSSPFTTEVPSEPPEPFEAIAAEDACHQAAARRAEADALADSPDEAAPGDRQILLDEARENRQRAADLGYPCA
jgi:hypothetical protein